MKNISSLALTCLLITFGFVTPVFGQDKKPTKNTVCVLGHTLKGPRPKNAQVIKDRVDGKDVELICWETGGGGKSKVAEDISVIKGDILALRGDYLSMKSTLDAIAAVTGTPVSDSDLETRMFSIESRLGLVPGEKGSYESRLEGAEAWMRKIEDRLAALEENDRKQDGEISALQEADQELKETGQDHEARITVLEDRGTGTSVLSVATGLEFGSIFNKTLPRLGFYATPSVVFGQEAKMLRLQVAGKFGFGGLREQDLPGGDLGGRLAANIHFEGTKLDVDIIAGFELDYTAINDQFRQGSTFGLIIGGVELYPVDTRVKIVLLGGFGKGFANDGDSSASMLGAGVNILWW